MNQKEIIENFAEKLILLNEKDKEKIEYLKGYIDAKIDED